MASSEFGKRGHSPSSVRYRAWRLIFALLDHREVPRMVLCHRVARQVLYTSRNGGLVIPAVFQYHVQDQSQCSHSRRSKCRSALRLFKTGQVPSCQEFLCWFVVRRQPEVTFQEARRHHEFETQ